MKVQIIATAAIFATIAIAQGDKLKIELLESVEKQSSIECSETILEYLIDGIKRETKSDYCDPHPKTIDPINTPDT